MDALRCSSYEKFGYIAGASVIATGWCCNFYASSSFVGASLIGAGVIAIVALVAARFFNDRGKKTVKLGEELWGKQRLKGRIDPPPLVKPICQKDAIEKKVKLLKIKILLFNADIKAFLKDYKNSILQEESENSDNDSDKDIQMLKAWQFAIPNEEFLEPDYLVRPDLR